MLILTKNAPQFSILNPSLNFNLLSCDLWAVYKLKQKYTYWSITILVLILFVSFNKLYAIYLEI